MAVRKINGSWRADFHWNGKRYRRKSPIDTRGGAEAYETELRQKLQGGESLAKAPVNADITFAAFSARWFDTYVRTNNKASEQHTKSIILRLHLVPWFGAIRLSGVKAVDIESYKAFKQSQKLSAKTINNHLMVLSKCLRTAVDWDELLAAPRIKLLQTRPPDRDSLTPAESRRLLEGTMRPLWRRTVWSKMVRVALRTGMRRGELCALDWSDVDFERGQIAVRRGIYRGHTDTPKNNRVRFLPMSDDVRALLASEQRREGLLFHRADGSPVAESTTTNALHDLCHQIGMRRIGWHVLRHTFASQLATKGIPLPVVQKLLGHSSISMTMRYTHLSPSTLKHAVDVLERAESDNNSDEVGH